MKDREEFINKIRRFTDTEFEDDILKGIDFDSSKLNNNLQDNENIIRSLCGCFSGIYDVLSNNLRDISYILKENPYLANLSIRYTSYRLIILNDDEIDINNKLLLISILDLISVYMYINKDAFYTKEDYLDKCILHIKENMTIYKEYFKENNIFDKESAFGPISSDGLLQEFIVIGEIVKSIYEKEDKVKKIKM